MATATDVSAAGDRLVASAERALTTAEPRACPICNDGAGAVLFADAKVDAGRLDSFAFASRKNPELMHHRLVRCTGCDVVYANPAPPAAALDRAYADADFDSAVEAAHASRTYGTILDRILDRLPSRAGALDVGTGDGSFLLELQRRGFTDVTGIEPSAAPVAAADPAVRPLIRHAPFTPDAVAAASLSLVTCFQTIEHLHDPMSFCTEVAGLLRPGGALLLVAHNRCSVSSRLLGERSPIFDVEHLQLFSPRSARTMLRRAGFTRVSSRVVVNRYPLTYWLRLSPLPSSVKTALIRLAAATPVGRLLIPLPAGNMAVVGFRPGGTSC